MNAIEWLNSFIGEKVGAGPNEQGNSKDTRVGIYYGNIQQASERFGLLNEAYTQAWIDLGVRFDEGLFENVPENFMVKLEGIDGVEWDKIRKEDLDHDMTVSISSENAEAQETEMNVKKKQAAIAQIVLAPQLLAIVNPRVLVEEIATMAEFSPERIRQLMDLDNYGVQDILDQTAEAIHAIVIDGKSPEEVGVIRGATTAVQQKIVDYATDHKDLPQKLFDALMIYAKAHDKTVIENMARKAMFAPKAPVDPNAKTTVPPAGNLPPSGAPKGILPGSIPSPLTPAVPANPPMQ